MSEDRVPKLDRDGGGGKWPANPSKRRERRLLSFGIVGIFGTGCHYLTLIILVELFGVQPVVATTLGFIVGMLVNYTLNRSFTFRSAIPHLEGGTKFLLVGVTTGLLNALAVFWGVELLGLNYLAVQVAATMVFFLVNFALNEFWTFRESRRP